MSVAGPRGPVVVPVDGIGAFVGAPSLLAEGPPGGALTGVTVGVKDLFDVAGTVTGAGNPDFAAGRAPAMAQATAVARLLAAGASVVGKTITDELAYSLAGTNVHHGTPANVAAPGHTPGGSSAGSAAAVAAGLVELGLGTDTGGSIRVPASYCGTYGWRPTHGAVPLGGAVPLAPSFDTAGLLARDPALLAAAAGVLLGADGRVAAAAPRLVVPAEVLADGSDRVAQHLLGLVDLLGGDVEPVALGIDLARAMAAFRTLQGAEAWQAHGAWISATRPTFGRGVAARFEAASRVTEAEVADAQVVRDEVRATLVAATADGRVLVVPAAASAAPSLTADPAGHDAHRQRTLRLTCLAGLAGLPVVVAPLLEDRHLPLGAAFVGAPGSDRPLLAWAAAALPH